MTADDIFNTVLGLMFCNKDEKADYEVSFIPMLNIIIAETFNINNARRMGNGKEEFLNIPQVGQLSDVIDYESIILRKVIPYGVAGMLYAEDDDTGMGEYYRQKYEAAKGETGYAQFSQIEEVI